MKVVLPKDSRAYGFPRLFSVDMNIFEIECLLPSLFFLVITGGRQRARRINDPTAMDRYVEALSRHPGMKGFDDAFGRRALRQWVAASLIVTGKKGTTRAAVQQIEYVRPLTLLSYKPGFPAETSRQRNVHTFLYESLLEAAKSDTQGASPEDTLRTVFMACFGQGIEIGTGPMYSGHYDGKLPLDIQSVLSAYYLDGFEPTGASSREALNRPDAAMPEQCRQAGRDLLLFMQGYQDRLPTAALTNHLMALTSLELFIYTVKLYYATNALVRDRELPGAMQQEMGVSPPQVYVDFTHDRGKLSDVMARGCVERDIEELRAFYRNLILLRTIDVFQKDDQSGRDPADLRTPRYLRKLVKVIDLQELNIWSQLELRHIREDTLDACDSDTSRHEVEEFFDELGRAKKSSLDKLADVIADSQSKYALDNYLKWFSSSGGLTRPFGILSGALNNRRSWRYAMTDELLTTLVHLSLLKSSVGAGGGIRIRERLRLSEFLKFLEERFGILVNRPPDFQDTLANRESAKGNLEAMKRRLRQMGFLQVLSDDFTAQYIRLPVENERGRT